MSELQTKRETMHTDSRFDNFARYHGEMTVISEDISSLKMTGVNGSIIQNRRWNAEQPSATLDP